MSESERTGWVDAHTHLYSGLAPLGLPRPAEEPQGLRAILEQVWWKLDRALDESTLRAAARLYVAEARAEGTTTLIDHHESPNFIDGSLDVLAAACHEFGMRAVLTYGATERNGGRNEARQGLAECARFARAGSHPDVLGVIGLHASFTVSDETIREAGALARELGTVVHVHVAEGEEDDADARERGYQNALDRLLALDGLPPGSILAHGVHLGPEDVRRCLHHGLWLVQAPRSNAANGVGYPRSLIASPDVALGTDGFPSDVLAEGVALIRDASANGEELKAVLPRVYAGERLAEGLFGSTITPAQEPPGPEALEAIRAEAGEAAERLWQRFRAL